MYITDSGVTGPAGSDDAGLVIGIKNIGYWHLRW
jgi:hypothetical protein